MPAESGANPDATSVGTNSRVMAASPGWAAPASRLIQSPSGSMSAVRRLARTTRRGAVGTMSG